ncbi:MAG: phytanoyl-CoA dioxygenase family protein [Betaproteobacteria bacterium]
MNSGNAESLGSRFDRDGYVSGVELLTNIDALAHRHAMEAAEARIGPLHYRAKIHTIALSPLQLATLPAVLDVVEQIIGPDILLYNVTYIVKEPGAPSHVSWHQDLTYWGLSHDDGQVSMWLALSPTTEEAGCMRMIPGSHRWGKADHVATQDPTNVLLQGQMVRNVDESLAVPCPLAPGQASFHHGWTLHASGPNRSADRRIGLNVQYMAPYVRQTKHNADTAVLVRGVDRFHHFRPDIVAVTDLDPVAIARQEALDAKYRAIAGTS